MKNILEVNSLKLEVIRPLAKWRILSLGELAALTSIPVSYWHVQKLVTRFEKAKILKSFRDPWTSRKLVYLENLGRGMFGHESTVSINEETLLHDAKVSEICRMLLAGKVFKEASLEHELSRKLFLTGDFTPDALLKGIKNEKSFSMGLELELTRKSNERLLTKAKHYLNSDLVDYVLYFFCMEPIYRCYKNTFSEGLPKGWDNKLILMWNPTLISRELSMKNGVCFFQQKECSYEEIF